MHQLINLLIDLSNGGAMQAGTISDLAPFKRNMNWWLNTDRMLWLIAAAGAVIALILSIVMYFSLHSLHAAFMETPPLTQPQGIQNLSNLFDLSKRSGGELTLASLKQQART